MNECSIEDMRVHNLIAMSGVFSVCDFLCVCVCKFMCSSVCEWCEYANVCALRTLCIQSCSFGDRDLEFKLYPKVSK